MLRFDVPQIEEGYSVWIELQTHDELPEEWLNGTTFSLDRTIKERGAVVIHSPSNEHPITHTISYDDLLVAFPDIDPEKVYPVIHYE